MKYRDDTADIKVGDRVQVTRETADRGSWRRYKDKYGNVTSVNSSVGEVGVEIGGSVAYFLPEEIRLVRRAGWWLFSRAATTSRTVASASPAARPSVSP